ncbi:addiction module antitoxin [Candidatus Magnetoovum chiemensis]|nr:addiction module antitoxin [Candidatus Magnetoovum chiemensis]
MSLIKYDIFYTDTFKKDLKAIKSKFDLRQKLLNKIEEILENPYHYKPLSNILKNKRRTHIGSYILIFEIKEDKKLLVFHSFQHHDKAYKQNC